MMLGSTAGLWAISEVVLRYKGMTMTLSVTSRDETMKLDELRVNGGVPAVVYGPTQEPMAVAIDGKEFDKVLKEAGEATVVSLSGLSKPVDVLIKGVDFNPVKQRVMHVDFYVVDQNKEVTTHVPVHLVGEAPVEESKAGVVNKVLHDLTVSAKPNDLPAHIDVDISGLAAAGDKILVGDIKLPKGVAVEEEADEAVVVVSAIKEEVEEEEVATVDMSAIEVEKKGKTDTEEEK